MCNWKRSAATLVFLVTALLVQALPAQDKAGGKGSTIQEISLDGLTIPPVPATGSVHKPAEIKNSMELAKVFPSKDTQDKIAKKVDFTKQFLLYFRWTGSGGDKISPTLSSSDPVIVFTYKAGLTDDVKHHARLFALTKGATWKIVP